MSVPLTLGEFRELTHDLNDEVLIKWMVPDGPDDWRTVGFDVTVYLAGGPKVIVFEADESIDQPPPNASSPRVREEPPHAPAARHEGNTP